jgi:hypothetical protein
MFISHTFTYLNCYQTRLSSAVFHDGQLPKVTASELHAMMEDSAKREGYASAYSKALERLDKLLQVRLFLDLTSIKDQIMYAFVCILAS